MVTIEIKQETLNNLKAFLGRVNLTGQEVGAFNQILIELHLVNKISTNKFDKEKEMKIETSGNLSMDSSSPEEKLEIQGEGVEENGD